MGFCAAGFFMAKENAAAFPTEKLNIYDHSKHKKM